MCEKYSLVIRHHSSPQSVLALPNSDEKPALQAVCAKHERVAANSKWRGDFDRAALGQHLAFDPVRDQACGRVDGVSAEVRAEAAEGSASDERDQKENAKAQCGCPGLSLGWAALELIKARIKLQ